MFLLPFHAFLLFTQLTFVAMTLDVIYSRKYWNRAFDLSYIAKQIVTKRIDIRITRIQKSFNHIQIILFA